MSDTLFSATNPAGLFLFDCGNAYAICPDTNELITAPVMANGAIDWDGSYPVEFDRIDEGEANRCLILAEALRALIDRLS